MDTNADDIHLDGHPQPHDPHHPQDPAPYEQHEWQPDPQHSLVYDLLAGGEVPEPQSPPQELTSPYQDQEHNRLLHTLGRAPIPVQSPGWCYPSYITTNPCAALRSPAGEGEGCGTHLSHLTDLQLSELLETFTTMYPEFTTHDLPTPLHFTARRLQCLYPSHTCVGTDCQKHQFFLLLAHYLTLSLHPNTAPNPVTSSSVGDASISYDTSYSQRFSPFFFWLNKTPYGQELLMILRRDAGVIVV